MDEGWARGVLGELSTISTEPLNCPRALRPPGMADLGERRHCRGDTVFSGRFLPPEARVLQSP